MGLGPHPNQPPPPNHPETSQSKTGLVGGAWPYPNQPPPPNHPETSQSKTGLVGGAWPYPNQPPPPNHRETSQSKTGLVGEAWPPTQTNHHHHLTTLRRASLRRGSWVRLGPTQTNHHHLYNHPETSQSKTGLVGGALPYTSQPPPPNHPETS